MPGVLLGVRCAFEAPNNLYTITIDQQQGASREMCQVVIRFAFVHSVDDLVPPLFPRPKEDD
jgi:hypothetical protein